MSIGYSTATVTVNPSPIALVLESGKEVGDRLTRADLSIKSLIDLMLNRREHSEDLYSLAHLIDTIHTDISFASERMNEALWQVDRQVITKNECGLNQSRTVVCDSEENA